MDVKSIPKRERSWHAPAPAGGTADALRPRSGAVAAAAIVAAAAGWSERPTPRLPRLGLVLGTGLGGLVERIDGASSILACETAWLVPSTATGHAGRVVCGVIRGRGSPEGDLWACELVALQGRVHGYEGHAPEALSRGMELVAALGAATVLLTNAAGGLRPDMRVGELTVLTDHVDLVRRPWTRGLGRQDEEPAIVIPRSAAAPSYDPRLVSAALEAARSVDAVARSGVYAHVMGPTYETRAEYRMLRKLGADVVGMSTVPEVIVARRLGLRVAAVSVVTNVARPDASQSTDAENVCRAAAAAAEGVWSMIVHVARMTASSPAAARGIAEDRP